MGSKHRDLEGEGPAAAVLAVARFPVALSVGGEAEGGRRGVVSRRRLSRLPCCPCPRSNAGPRAKTPRYARGQIRQYYMMCIRALDQGANLHLVLDAVQLAFRGKAAVVARLLTQSHTHS